MIIKRLEYTDGCICTSLDVDNKEFNIDLTFEERKEVCLKIVNQNTMDIKLIKELLETYLECYENNINIQCKKVEWGFEVTEDLTNESGKEYLLKAIELVPKDNDWFFQELFMKFMETYGKFKDLGHCDCCGDWIRRWTLKVK